jgi:hypothetical protein
MDAGTILSHLGALIAGALDPRKKQCFALPLCDARELFSQQATELSKDGSCIRSYILDASLS